MFAAGVTLFKMFFGFMPFMTTNLKKPSYDERANLVKLNQWDFFWGTVSNHEGRTDVPVPTKELTNILSALLSGDVSERYTMDKLPKLRWLKEKVVKKEKAVAAMERVIIKPS